MDSNGIYFVIDFESRKLVIKVVAENFDCFGLERAKGAK